MSHVIKTSIFSSHDAGDHSAASVSAAAVNGDDAAYHRRWVYVCLRVVLVQLKYVCLSVVLVQLSYEPLLHDGLPRRNLIVVLSAGALTRRREQSRYIETVSYLLLRPALAISPCHIPRPLTCSELWQCREVGQFQDLILDSFASPQSTAAQLAAEYGWVDIVQLLTEGDDNVEAAQWRQTAQDRQNSHVCLDPTLWQGFV